MLTAQLAAGRGLHDGGAVPAPAGTEPEERETASSCTTSGREHCEGKAARRAGTGEPRPAGKAVRWLLKLLWAVVVATVTVFCSE